MSTICQDHVHIVVHAPAFTDLKHLKGTITAATRLTTPSRTHVLTGDADKKLLDSMHGSVIVEPSVVGGSPVIAFAGCHLYRLDPNSVMVYVDGCTAVTESMLRQNFAKLVVQAEIPGALVSLLAGPDSPANIYAWSVYALMESYRNFCPVDFQIINEMARTWNRDPARTTALYEKLTQQDVVSHLLNQIQPGYYTRNVVVDDSTSIAAPLQCSDVSHAAIIATPKESN